MKRKPINLMDLFNDYLDDCMDWIIYKPILSKYENVLYSKNRKKIIHTNFATKLTEFSPLDVFYCQLEKDLIDKQKK